MADSVVPRKTIFVSDLTGAEINALDVATVTIRYADARRGQIVLDVNCKRSQEMAAKREELRRGVLAAAFLLNVIAAGAKHDLRVRVVKACRLPEVDLFDVLG